MKDIKTIKCNHEKHDYVINVRFSQNQLNALNLLFCSEGLKHLTIIGAVRIGLFKMGVLSELDLSYSCSRKPKYFTSSVYGFKFTKKQYDEINAFYANHPVFSSVSQMIRLSLFSEVAPHYE